MRSPTLLRRLIIGRRAFILSHVEFKKIMLTGQMALVVFLVALGYGVFDLFSGVYGSWPYEATCAILALASFFLNRSARHTPAKIVLVIAANLTVYLFAASEAQSTELSVFFIVIAIATVAGFGYEQRFIAIGFIGLTLALYLASAYFDFTPVREVSFDPNYVRNNKIINFITALVSASLLVYALVSVNYHSEKALVDSEQAMVQKNEELTRLNVELDRFVYSSSHDLIAPLRSVLGLLTLCNLSEDREETKKYLAMIKERVDELQRFIKEMSDYSKNGRSAVVFEEIELDKMLREVLETLRFYPDSEKLTVDIDIEDELVVYSDHMRLKAILSNIISNSFKYSDLKKNAPFVKIFAARNHSMLHLEISDNGLGINEADLPKIFDMFYRAHEHAEGSGLGLYIVKETIDKLGGTIEVDSVVGRGTKFRITLPMNLTKLRQHVKVE
ncbi:MAG TPA: HAMP domain-containing sensor histidine kinase [Cyclobacteriaceae bacterium]|nr:HAMP domain-containing sensor histidine kinase [Cyclobacteriaceae bacterium]